MNITVRLNGTLPLLCGGARLSMSLPESATVADLIERLAVEWPEARESLTRAIPVLGGEAAAPDAPLADACEVSLLMPVSGGEGKARR